jgi:hypothetical protein
MKKYIIYTLLSFFIILSQSLWAEVPPPPANQIIGINDGVFNDLTEADCRVCHDETVDRHHLLYDSVIPDPTDAPFGVPGETYTCLSCHEVINNGIDPIQFIVERDCMICHIQGSSFELTVHHRTDEALGNLPQGPDCKVCHGSLVDNIEDGHFIPTYDPSPRTPKRSGSDGLPLNSEGTGAGGCDYCHSTGTGDPTIPGLDGPSGVLVYSNEDTHHETGFWGGMGAHGFVCFWCHDDSLPFEAQIRVCENCHGPDSLHNIQTDSDGDGIITPGIELPGYGHIGNPDDCWGCHGFSIAETPPQFGSITPFTYSVSKTVITEGSDAIISLTGSAFTNSFGETELTSIVNVTGDNDFTIDLMPDIISQNMLTVTLPGTLTAGNYALRAVKFDKISNPIPISIIPEVVITAVTCEQAGDTYSTYISGSGFGDQPPDGIDEVLNVKQGGVPAEAITSWTDTAIQASVHGCTGVTTVNALYGTANSCECEGNFDSDEDVDGSDAILFKADFGRSVFLNPCYHADDICNGDFDCDGDVDGTDASVFKKDFGRNTLNNPCPTCAVEQWCNYH